MNPLADMQYLFKPNDKHYAAGQPSESQFKSFADLGVRKVINIRPDSETVGMNIEAIVKAAGMSYVSIPIAAAEDLNLENVKLLDAALSEAGSDSVLIHCGSSNRVGALFALRAAWLYGKEKKDALNTGVSYGLAGLTPTVDYLLSLEH